MSGSTAAAEKIGSLVFESPITMEGSWGARRIADKAQSTMDLYFGRDGTGSIEWTCEALDLYEDIGLVFEFDRAGKRTLTDYDGVMDLPDQAMDLLEQHGVDCKAMRKSLAD